MHLLSFFGVFLELKGTVFMKKQQKRWHGRNAWVRGLFTDELNRYHELALKTGDGKLREWVSSQVDRQSGYNLHKVVMGNVGRIKKQFRYGWKNRNRRKRGQKRLLVGNCPLCGDKGPVLTVYVDDDWFECRACRVEGQSNTLVLLVKEKQLQSPVDKLGEAK